MLAYRVLKYVVTEDINEKIEEDLNRLPDEGWQFVSMVAVDGLILVVYRKNT